MRLVAASQRVDLQPDYGERRDGLDQNWARFLAACGAALLPLPNHPAAAAAILARVPVDAVLLTGGGDLVEYGGTAPERDTVDRLLLAHAAAAGKPVLAVCRGLQFLACAHGIALARRPGHVATRHRVDWADGSLREVNSFHNFCLPAAPEGFEVLAAAGDGTVEAMRSQDGRVLGVMWHPEREGVPDPRDIALFRDHLGVVPCVD